MSKLFVQDFRARWVDMDFNQHMRNAAYLGCAEDTRMSFLDANGWTMAEFMKRQVGPVVLEDKLVYKKELKLLEPFTVDLTLGGATSDGRRMRLCSRFVRTRDQALCATVESAVLWLSLETRRPIVPPAALRDLWLSLQRTDDFKNFDEAT